MKWFSARNAVAPGSAMATRRNPTFRRRILTIGGTVPHTGAGCHLRPGHGGLRLCSASLHAGHAGRTGRTRIWLGTNTAYTALPSGTEERSFHAPAAARLAQRL